MVRWVAVMVCLGGLGRAAVLDPGVPESLIEQGHWKRARALVEARLRDAPEDARANFLLSQICNAFGDHDSPLRLAEKAVALDGGAARYHRQIAEVDGVLAQHAGLFQQLSLAHRFRAEIDTALDLDSHDLQSLRDLMEFYLLAPGIAGGDQKKAEGVAGRIAAIDAAQGFAAQARLARFHKDPTSEERWLRRVVEARPEDYGARMALAAFYLASAHADPARALEQALAARNIDPTRADAYSALAQIYAGRQEWKPLEEMLAAAARETPDDLAPYYRAATRLLETGHDLPRAERYLRAYLSQEPEGNEPTRAEARGKLESVRERLRQAGLEPAAVR